METKPKDSREEWYDPGKRVYVTIADAASAAQALVRGHLSGPAASYFLSKAICAAALLGAEMEDSSETLSIQMKCDGPLGGFNVECTAQGTLRGYVEKKILDAFDGAGTPDAAKAVGARRLQVTRSVPGRIISQGISSSLDGYLAGSLQRKARIFLEASVSDECEVLEARGVMVEALPDSRESVSEIVSALEEKLRRRPGALAASSRKLLDAMGLGGAVPKKSIPLSFACRCSAERAAAMLAALGEEERTTLPPAVDITCHMCGRTWSVPTGNHA